MEEVKVETETNTEPKLSIKDKYVQCLQKCINSRVLLVIFVYLNIFNYFERSLLPGSITLVQDFIGIEFPDQKQFLFGLLQSAFILGYSVASAIFGYYSDPKKPFITICIGLSIWLCAVLLSALAPNYYVLLIARIISGVGEASFQIVVPAYFDDYAPQNRVGSWLAYLYCALPVGSALGFSLSGIISDYLGWRFLFYIIPPFVIPCLCILFFYPVDESQKTRIPSESDLERERNIETNHISYCNAMFILIKSLTFDLLILGDAVVMFIGTAFSSFIDKFLVGLGIFTSDSQASLYFGIIGASAGFLGTYLGGLLLDYMNSKKKSKIIPTFQHLIITAMCTVISGALVYVLTMNSIAFLIFLFFTCFFLYASNSSFTLGVLTSVPSSLRPMALGISMILIHLLGDVPSPAITGALLDYLIGQETDPEKLYSLYRLAIGILISSTLMMVVFWGLGLLYVLYKHKRNENNNIQESLLENSDNKTDIIIITDENKDTKASEIMDKSEEIHNNNSFVYDNNTNNNIVITTDSPSMNTQFEQNIKVINSTETNQLTTPDISLSPLLQTLNETQ